MIGTMARNNLVAIAAGGGAAALVVVVGVVLAVRACSGGSQVSAGARPAPVGHVDVADLGMNAPGAAELRRLGCEHALVVDLAKLLGDAGNIREGEPRTMVTCDVPAGVDPPTCERAAAVYFVAVGGAADAAINIRVMRAGAATPSCSRLYAPSGADLGPFPRGP
jgi:hypothetical protein